jgi:hypothetical protein
MKVISRAASASSPSPVNAAEQAKGAAVSGRYLVLYREVSPDALAIPPLEVAVVA